MIQAKAKIKRREYADDAELEKKHAEKVSKRKRSEQIPIDHKSIGGGALRGVMDETMIRVYHEMFPNASNIESDQGQIDIREESYILSLTMICGNDNYQPRRGLKIREAEISDELHYCKEHSE